MLLGKFSKCLKIPDRFEQFYNTHYYNLHNLFRRFVHILTYISVKTCWKRQNKFDKLSKDY